METVTDEQILKAVKFFRNAESENKTLLANAQNVRLRFCMFKLPILPDNCRNIKLVRIVLKHQLPHNDACLIVSDGENRQDRTKIDDTIESYQEIFRKEGITGIKEVIPLLKLKLEYQTYESKRALSTRYETVMADAKIYRFLPSLMGKHFFGKRLPMQVDVNHKGLAKRMKRDLRTQICQLSLKGTNSSVIVGQLEMKDEEIIENVRDAIKRIGDVIPGGEQNIHTISLLVDNYTALPIYYSNVDRSKVPVPELPLSFQSEGETLEGEVSTVKGKVAIGADGSVIITKRDGTKQVIGAQDEKCVPKVNRGPMARRVGKKRGKRGGAGAKKKLDGKLRAKVADSPNISKGKKMKKSKVATGEASAMKPASVGSGVKTDEKNLVGKGHKRKSDASQPSTSPKKLKTPKKGDISQSMVKVTPTLSKVPTEKEPLKTKTPVSKTKTPKKQVHSASPSVTVATERSSVSNTPVFNSAKKKQLKEPKKTPTNTTWKVSSDVEKTPVSGAVKKTPLKVSHAANEMSKKVDKKTPLKAVKTPLKVDKTSPKVERTPLKTDVMTPKAGKMTPKAGKMTPKAGKMTPKADKMTPMKTGKLTPKAGKMTPMKDGKKTPIAISDASQSSDKKTPKLDRKTPKLSKTAPSHVEKTPLQAGKKFSPKVSKTPLSNAAMKTPKKGTPSKAPSSAVKKSGKKLKASNATPLKAV